jgi:hypothetical protein
VLKLSRLENFRPFLERPGFFKKSCFRANSLATGDNKRLHGHCRFYGGNAANASGKAPPAKSTASAAKSVKSLG